MRFPDLKKRLEALEQPARELIVAVQEGDGTLTIDGKTVTRKEIERQSKLPGKIVLLIVRED